MVEWCEKCHLCEHICSLPSRKLLITWKLWGCCSHILKYKCVLFGVGCVTSIGKKYFTISFTLGNRMFLSIISEKRPAETPQHWPTCISCTHTHEYSHKKKKKHAFTTTSKTHCLCHWEESLSQWEEAGRSRKLVVTLYVFIISADRNSSVRE